MAGPGIIQSDLYILRDLSYISGLRGFDSTGIVQGVTRGRKLRRFIVEKDPHSIEYFTMKHAHFKDGNKEVFNNVNNTFFGVHLRAATRGSINRENSHPFVTPKYIGMHNGTLVDHQFQDKDKTDSELLFNKINEEGISPVLSDLNPKSAYVIVMVDINTGELIFSRNDLRTIYFAINEKRSVIYWASEDWMLRGILGRHGEKLKNNAIIHLKQGFIYKFHPEEFSHHKDGYFRIEKIEKKERLKEETVEELFQDNKKNEITSKILEKSIGKSFKKKIPEAFCCSCSKEMNLVERFFATESFSQSVFVCENCKDFNLLNPNFFN